jgi:hypothetical protein
VLSAGVSPPLWSPSAFASQRVRPRLLDSPTPVDGASCGWRGDCCFQRKQQRARAYGARRRGLDSARRVVLVWWLACDGDGGGDVRPATRRAVDTELAVEECEPVAEAEEAASVGPRAADAVIADVHVQRAVVG